MRWLAVFTFVFLPIFPLLGNETVEVYCREFWSQGREAPRWESSPVAEPLSFEELPSLANTSENIGKVSQGITTWDVQGRFNFEVQPLS